MAVAGNSESARLEQARRSKAPVIIGGMVLAAATAGIALFVLNRAPKAGKPATESAATAPATAPAADNPPGPGAPAAPTAPSAPAAAGEPAAAPAAAAAEKKPDEAKGAAEKTAPTAAPEPDQGALAADKNARGPGHKAGGSRRRLAAKAAELAAARSAAEAAPAAEAPSQPQAPQKVEVVGQGPGDGAEKAPAAKDEKQDEKEDKKPDGTAAKAPAGQRVLKITSTPSGAEVLVDGASVGRTPFLDNKIDPASPHTVTVKKEGYDNNEHVIGASDWSRPHNGVQTLKLTIKLRKAGGGGGEKGKGAEAEAAAPPGDSASPASAKRDDKKDEKKDEAPASP